MRLLKIIWRTALGLLETIGRIPRSLVGVFRQLRQRSALNLRETERLDRIRHPSKYLGKP